MTTPTVAIATGILGKATETGVRRHIALLFGGNTVVFCETRDSGHESARPTFVQRPGPGLGARLEFELGKPVNSLRYGSSGVPSQTNEWMGRSSPRVTSTTSPVWRSRSESTH